MYVCDLCNSDACGVDVHRPAGSVQGSTCVSVSHFVFLLRSTWGGAGYGDGPQSWIWAMWESWIDLLTSSFSTWHAVLVGLWAWTSKQVFSFSCPSFFPPIPPYTFQVNRKEKKKNTLCKTNASIGWWTDESPQNKRGKFWKGLIMLVLDVLGKEVKKG